MILASLYVWPKLLRSNKSCTHLARTVHHNRRSLHQSIATSASKLPTRSFSINCNCSSSSSNNNNNLFSKFKFTSTNPLETLLQCTRTTNPFNIHHDERRRRRFSIYSLKYAETHLDRHHNTVIHPAQQLRAFESLGPEYEADVAASAKVRRLVAIGQYDEAIQLYLEMRDDIELQPSCKSTFDHLLHACRAKADGQLAMSLIRQMLKASAAVAGEGSVIPILPPDIKSFSLALMACIKGKQYGDATNLFEFITQNLFGNTSARSSFEQRQRWWHLVIKEADSEEFLQQITEFMRLHDPGLMDQDIIIHIVNKSIRFMAKRDPTVLETLAAKKPQPIEQIAAAADDMDIFDPNLPYSEPIIAIDRAGDVEVFEHLVQRSAQWHELRAQTMITASEVPAIMGHNPFKSPTDVFLEKIGLKEKFKGNEATQWGQIYESDAATLYEKISGNTVRSAGFVRRTGEFIGGSPDGLVDRDQSRIHSDPSTVGKPGCIEIKCPHKKIVHNAIPEYYVGQCMTVMHCSASSWCDYISYVPPLLSESAIAAALSSSNGIISSQNATTASTTTTTTTTTTADTPTPQMNIIRTKFNEEEWDTQYRPLLQKFTECVRQRIPPDWDYVAPNYFQ